MAIALIEESYLRRVRRLIEEQYLNHPTGCGNSFGEILCFEIHQNNLTFYQLSRKWEISLAAVGELIFDHCKLLASDPVVDYNYQSF